MLWRQIVINEFEDTIQDFDFIKTRAWLHPQRKLLKIEIINYLPNCIQIAESIWNVLSPDYDFPIFNYHPTKNLYIWNLPTEWPPHYISCIRSKITDIPHPTLSIRHRERTGTRIPFSTKKL